MELSNIFYRPKRLTFETPERYSGGVLCATLLFQFSFVCYDHIDQFSDIMRT